MLSTKDNSKLILSIEQQERHLDDLRWMAASTIKDMYEQTHSRLLIFPQSFNEYGDKLDDQRLFNIYGNTIETGNIMGFVGRNDTMIQIQSRFASSDGKDYFLHYMLQKVFAINLFDLKHLTEKESIFDFLVYLFPTFLCNAVRHGLYNEYQTRTYNDTNVRGRIDVSRHIRSNIPFKGTVAYTTREYVGDNNITQLIRHTIEYIYKHPLGNGILSNDDFTKEAVTMIREATPKYDRNARQYIINANIRPLHHPYFADYKSLQNLCLQILQHEELKYGHDKDKVYGILFDGAWLWEEYLYTFLNPFFYHPRNKLRKGKQYIFKNSLNSYCYPDFYNERIVLDAKYKDYTSWNLQSADLYQIISYMYIMQLKYGGFIVPVENETEPKTLNGYEGKINIYGLRVNNKSYQYNEYCANMQKKEEILLNTIKKEFL